MLLQFMMFPFTVRMTGEARIARPVYAFGNNGRMNGKTTTNHKDWRRYLSWIGHTRAMPPRPEAILVTRKKATLARNRSNALNIRQQACEGQEIHQRCHIDSLLRCSAAEARKLSQWY